MWRKIGVCAVGLALLMGCGKSESTGAPGDQAKGQANEKGEAAPQLPAGDPEKLPKIVAERGKIAGMLRERFGDPVTRNLQIEIEQMGDGKKVTVSGEVPSEQFRQAIMKELEARVSDMKASDFRLEIAGAVRQLFTFEANLRDAQVEAFSPDLSLFVSHSGDVYEVATGRRINRMAFPTNKRIYAIVFSPDGKWLATGFQNSGLMLWKMPLGRDPVTLSPFKEGGTSYEVTAAAAFTSDGKSLVSINSRRGEVIWWDLATGKSKTIGAHLTENSPGQSGEEYVVAVSPDGKMIASAQGRDRAITLWDVASRSKKGTLSAVEVLPGQMAWSHDGKLLAISRVTSEPRGVGVYDVASGKARTFARERDEMISAIAFSPDDRLLAVNYASDGVGLWNVAAGKEWQTLAHEKTSSGHAIAISRDGCVLATVGETLRPWAVRLWDVSRHPGTAGGTAHLPAPVAVGLVQDDQVVSAIEQSIRGSFPPGRVAALKVELKEGGVIELTGKVADENVKRRAQEKAEMYLGREEGVRVEKVVNKLEAASKSQ